MTLEQAATLNCYEIPAHINALDAQLTKDMTKEAREDLHYRLRVVYTLESATKSRAHVEFLTSDTAEDKEIKNVLVKHEPSDDYYPYMPKKVVKLVQEKTGDKTFTGYTHTQAWHKFKVRPPANSRQPQDTNKDFCIYHKAHGDYSYSQGWINKLVAVVKDNDQYKDLKSYKIKND